jgi:hypothetical protein
MADDQKIVTPTAPVAAAPAATTPVVKGGKKNKKTK